MIAMEMKNNGKRLVAAIIAMAMIICAVAVVAMPSEAEDGTTALEPPVATMGTGAVQITVDEAVTNDAGLETLFGDNYQNQTLTVPAAGMTITLNADMGTSTTPLDFHVVLNGDLVIQSTNGSSFYINNSANAVTFTFAADDTVFQVDGNINVSLDSTQRAIFDSRINGTFTSAVYVTGGADLTISNETGTTWINADPTSSSTTAEQTYLVVEGNSATDRSTVDFVDAHSIQGVTLIADYADIRVDSEATGIVLKAGTVLTNSTLTSSAYYFGMSIKGDVKLVNSSITSSANVNNSSGTFDGIQFSVYGNGLGTDDNAPSIDVDAGSSVTTSSYSLYAESTVPQSTSIDVKASITGAGTVTGDFNGLRTANAGNISDKTATYTLNGVTVQDSTAGNNDVAITIGESGIVASGDVNFADATITATTGKIIEGADSNLNVGNNDAVVFNSEDGVSTVGMLINAAAQENQGEIGYTFTDDTALTADLVIGTGTTIAPTNDKTINLAGNSIISNGGGVKNLKVENNTATGTGVETSRNGFAILTLNGNFEINAGSIEVTGTLTGENQIVYRQGEIIISGSLNGTLEFVQNGTVAESTSVVFKDFTVNSGASVTFLPNANVTYSTEGRFSLYGSLLSDSAVTLNVGTTGTASQFTAYNGATIQQSVNITSYNDRSEINLDDSLKTMEIGQDVTSDLVYSQQQTVVIIDTLSITSHSTLTVMGQLIINEGVTLTIEPDAELIINSATAQMIVNGEIEVENNGKITVTDADSVTVAGTITSDGIVVINSNVTIQENGVVLIDNGTGSSISVTGGLTVQAGGQLEVRGGMSFQPDAGSTAAITNAGTIVLNGANLTTGSTINMAADGAVVDIRSFTASANNALNITDNGLVLYERNTTKVAVGQVAPYNGYDYSGTNTIIFSDDHDDVGIRNIVITEVVTSARDSDNVTWYDYGMNITGSPTIVDNTTGDSFDDRYTIQFTGVDLRVADGESLTLGAGVTISNQETLNVAGTVEALNSNAAISNSGTINVTGTVEVIEEIQSGINAAHYEETVSGTTHHFYTTLNAAVASGSEEIEIMGTVKVTESLEIPSPVQIRSTQEAVLVIGDEDNRDVTVTVADGASFRNFADITVDGTLEFANNRDNRGNTIYSDVQVSNEPGITYTNIYTALGNAENGDTVTITRTNGNVVLDSDIEVKEGVVLVVPNSRGLTFEDGVTMTINGTLRLLGEIDSATTNGFVPEINGEVNRDAATIVVNGTLMSITELPYATSGEDADTEYGYYIAGAYYNIINNTGDYWYITPVEQAGAVSDSVDQGVIEIYGDNTAGDVEFTGDAEQPVTVTLMQGASLTASSVTLNRATLDADTNENGGFSGTVDSAVGSVVFVNATNFTVADTVGTNDRETMAVSGSPSEADADAGDVTITIATGNVTVNGTLSLGSLDAFSISEGATLTVTGNNGRLSANTMTVDGTLVSTNNGNIRASVMTVRGTLTVEPQNTENNTAAGTANIGVLNVGIALDRYGHYGNASAATVSAESIDSLTRVVVSAESSVSGGLTDRMNSTEFYVEDALWITVYVASGTNSYISEYEPAELTECDFLNWNDANGDDVEDAVVGDPDYQQVYADINYNVYFIMVYTDGGIGSVAIDGVVLMSTGNNAFYNLNGLTAGQHTITYTLKSGYEGQATISIDGQPISGNTFTLSGDFNGTSWDPENPDLVLNITGTTPVTPGSGDITVNVPSQDDGMSLTDILLIVLVILILVMAIIVALRLMRS